MVLSRKLQWMMRALLWVALVSAAVGTSLVQAQHLPDAPNTTRYAYDPVEGKGGQEISGPYQVVMNWPQPVIPGWTTTGVAIYVESPDRIYVAGRGMTRDAYKVKRNWGPQTIKEIGHIPLVVWEYPKESYKQEHMICVYDRNGKLLDSWEQWNSQFPPPGMNRIQVSPYDPERHFWIVTHGPVLEFTQDGKTLVKTLDEKDVPQDGSGKPGFAAEELAWLPNGDMLVAGGYRVMRFSKEGKYLSAFGKQGSGPGEFGAGIHGVSVDIARHRMYIADRMNSRIEVFDENGKFLDRWEHILAPYCIRLTKDGRYLWVSDGFAMKFQKYDALTGRLVPNSTWGTFGVAPGAFWGIHYFTTDGEGNLYTAEDYGGRVQKFVLRKDPSVNPAQVIGQLQ
jgi:6-bladed beta-propeller protein